MTRTGALMPPGTANSEHDDLSRALTAVVSHALRFRVSSIIGDPDDEAVVIATAASGNVSVSRCVDVRVRDPWVDRCPLDRLFDDEEAAMTWAARDHQQNPDRDYEARVRWQVRADGSPDGWQPILLAAPEPDPRAEALAHLDAAVTALRLASGALTEADNAAHANEALAVATALGRLKAAAAAQSPWTPA
jgi:Zn-finger nucleic acid-binding protein